MAWTLIVGLIALAWLVSYGLGGTKSVGPHLFYVPVLVAAFRFGSLGALGVAVLCGVAAGPPLPLDVELGAAQDATGWLGRAAAFVLVGQITAALSSRSLPVSLQRLDDHRTRRLLEEATANGEFFPVYQPIVDLEGGEIVGVETLARRRLPDGRIESPGEFVPAAERTGAIRAIDRTILDQACRQLQHWQDSGAVPDSFYVTVNLSGVHLQDPGLPAQIANVMQPTGVDAGCVMLEITETALIDDPVGAAERLWQLKRLGVSIALDDLGVGYSSLSTLGRFPIDVVKIDRSFVADVLDGSRSRRLVQGIIRLAEAMTGHPAVAEGIETTAQLSTLRSLGCTRGQGFVFKRPVPADELESTLRAGPITPSGATASP